MKYVIKFILVCLVIFLWFAGKDFVYYAALGPDPCIQLDANHFLNCWPGFITQRQQDNTFDCFYLRDVNDDEYVPSDINKYAVSEKYIVAKAGQGWLAISRASLQVWGCYGTIEELEEATGAKFGEVKFKEEYSFSDQYVREGWKKHLVVVTVICLVIIGVIVFYPTCSKSD